MNLANQIAVPAKAAPPLPSIRFLFQTRPAESIQKAWGLLSLSLPSELEGLAIAGFILMESPIAFWFSP
jgi:hypothetical protein